LVAPVDLTTRIQRFGQVRLRHFLSENYPLLSILIGFMLVSLTLGPYQNGDTTWEMDAVSGVLKTGLPLVNGYLMDQPPIGFYIQAALFSIFGVSIDDGTFLVTLFGLGCVALVYGVGNLAINRTTGFFAALLFAFSPWHLVLSRTFLIDVPCLFFSLLSLFVALVAFKRNSLWLFIVSGVIFAVAFNTKLYAVYMLIPILTLLVKNHHESACRLALWFTAFAIPVLAASFLWYQSITGIGLISIFFHTDFSVPDPFIAVPIPFFTTNFLVNYAIGWFFVDSLILSVLVSLWQRRALQRFLLMDAICLAVIICVLTVNTYLGVTLNLKAPFLNAIKYDYQALPFISFLAASLLTKSLSLASLSKLKSKIQRASYLAVAFLGSFLVAASVLYNMRYTHMFSTWEYLIFRVDPNNNVGYSLFNFDHINAGSFEMSIQILGFAFAVSGMLWASRHKLGWALKRFGLNKNSKIKR
jgi:4-amino-4-deoxy-L-arabinose transferase-like glycosyltransferase